MPTDEWFKENPKVSAYIPQDLNEKLLEWMKSRNIKKVSQALTAILQEYLGVAQKVVQTEPITQPVRDDRLEALEQKFEILSQMVQEMREAVQISSPKIVQTELFSVKPIEEALSDDEAIALIDAKSEIDVVEEVIQDDEPDEILYEFLEPEEQEPTEEINDETKVEQSELNEFELWTTHQIKEILGVSRSNLERWKKEETLPKTAKEHTILRWAGKQKEKPFSNLWEVRKPPQSESLKIFQDTFDESD